MCLLGEGSSNKSDSEEKRRADGDREVGERYGEMREGERES